MMWAVFPATPTLAVVATILAVVLVSTRVIQPALWRSTPIRISIFLSFGAILIGFALWAAGHRYGPTVVYSGTLILGPAALVLPLSSLLDRLLHRAFVLDVPVPVPVPVPDLGLSRRSFIRAGTATLPAMAAITGARGILTANDPPRIPIIPMRYHALHPDLEGLRILQLSDLHLGACAGLDDLAKALDHVMATQRPDLIVLTGDLADDPDLIAGALELVTRARARLGAIASLGNHEYLHDIGVTRPRYEASPIPLLVSTGRTVTIGRARLFIGGADDPVHMHGDIAEMLRPSIERAAADAPDDANFRLLLCHRPEGFGPAADHRFDLTLSGHTHGGQIGLFGRSILEKLRPGTGWWGTYARPRPGSSPSRLYTTSGFGHWFPFRVGCPTEMPVIVLESERRAAATRQA